MNDQRMVDVELLEMALDALKLSSHGVVPALRAIIDGPGVEPAGMVVLKGVKFSGEPIYEVMDSPELRKQEGIDKYGVCFYLAAPSAPPAHCAECGKQASEGWALYCVECAGKMAPVQAVPDWQPIETAPKDGTHITLTNRRDLPATCHWFEGAWHLSMNRYGPFSQWTWDAPTHWMPLPKPPKESTAQSSAVACPTDKEK